jgi:hypothetical protein
VVFLWGWRRRHDDTNLRRWLLMTSFFGVWALGPYLMMFGSNTGLLLPQAAARFIPIVNNARMPSRAMVMVALSTAVLAAILLTRASSRRRQGLAMGAICLGCIELLATPLLLVPTPGPGVYTLISGDPQKGAVLPVPFGVSDGFGDTGVFEHDALFEQTVHGHALVGGFLGRLPARVRPWYESHEPYATLIALSHDRPRDVSWPTCDAVSSGLRAVDVSYVVVYPSRTSHSVADFVDRRMPLEKVGEDGQRVLYRVMPDDRPCR